MSESNALNSTLSNAKTNNLINDRKRKNNETMVNESKHLKSNYYSLLDIEDDFQCDESSLTKFKEHVQKNNTNVQPHNSENTNSSLSSSCAPSTSNNATQRASLENQKLNKQNKKDKIPPINIFDVQTDELIDFVKKGLNITDFKIKQYDNIKKNTLMLNSLESYVRVKTLLEKTNTKFFTYTPKCAKVKTFLLKGLGAITNYAEILGELRKRETETLKFINISPFYTNRSKKEGHILPIFLVQIGPEGTIRDLRAITGIMHRVIKWESLRKEEIPQCRRCQGFFLSASNCFLEPKCVKCNQSHELGKCNVSNVDTNERQKLFCVLCKKYGHPASYRGCEAYKKLKQKIKERREFLGHNRSQKFMNVNQNLTFANALKGNIDNNVLTNTNHNNNDFFQNLQNSIQNLANQISNFQKQLQSQAARIDALYEVLNFTS